MNILLIKPGAIGDLLHLTPVIRELKRLYPHSRITLLVGSRITATLFENNPLVAEVVVFDKRGAHRTLSGMVPLWKRFRSERFDLVLNYQRSNLRTWFLASAAWPCKVVVYHKTRRDMVHAIIDHLKPLRKLGVDIQNVSTSLDFFPTAADEASVERFLRDNDIVGQPLVAFNPGTSHQSKCWPLERFAQLGDLIVERYGARVVVVGSKDEKELADTIGQAMRHRAYDFTGCSLGELGELLKRTEFLVTGDTGPMHIATAVGCRVLALFGPISPHRSGPFGDGHRVLIHDELECCPCNRFKCKNVQFRKCMELISVEEVADAASQMFCQNR